MSPILEALLLMSVAAILGGIIVWLLMRNRIEESNSQSASSTSSGNDAALQADLERYKRAAADCEGAQAQLKTDFEAKIKSLEAELGQVKAELAEAGAKSKSIVDEAVASGKPSKEEKEAAALDRIRQRAAALDFGKIGTATADDKDDLKLVKGIGPFIEKKLNALGIYTFRQIANFDEDLEDKVNEAIEFFPGRIRRDDWKGQAAKMADEKEGK